MATEHRLLTGFRREQTNEPGLVIADGVVTVVAPGGVRFPILDTSRTPSGPIALGAAVPAVDAGDDATTWVLVGPYDGHLTRVSYAPAADSAIASGHARVLSLVGPGGVLALRVFDTEDPFVAGMVYEIPLSGTAAVAPGDLLYWTSEADGSDPTPADPGGVAIVHFVDPEPPTVIINQEVDDS